MTKPVYWTGPLENRCQISGREFSGVMYDARIPGRGWANIDQQAFDSLNCSLGIGHGQKYEQQADGRWLCVDGRWYHRNVTLTAEDQAQVAAEAKKRKRHD